MTNKNAKPAGLTKAIVLPKPLSGINTQAPQTTTGTASSYHQTEYSSSGY